MKLNVLTVVFMFLTICLLVPDKSAVLITVTYPVSTPTPIVIGEADVSFIATSTTDGVFITGQTNFFPTRSFNNDFTTTFTRVVDVDVRILTICMLN